MSIGIDSQSSSRDLSSSVSSLNHSSKRTSSEISKVYKHASQLFLTRRLFESYEALQPVITPSSQSRPDDSPALAPIATATTSQRIKIWSLYVTLLNSILELGDAEGKQLFGSKEYRDIVRRVQNGDVWEQIVNDGYHAREGSVDAEVVYNLSNLLLGQAPSQQHNQSRLESYFSSSAHPTLEASSLDLSTHLDRALSSSSNGHQKHATGLNGTNTPKDLTSRIKVLEIFTLHVLPRNSEWDYARSFIQNSDILDEERREAFLQTLEELQDVTTREGIDVAEAEEEIFEDSEEHHTDTGADGAEEQQQQSNVQKVVSKHQRTSSEVDYGIEKAHPTGSSTVSTAANGPAPAPAKSDNRAFTPVPTPAPAPTTKPAFTPQPTSTPRSPPPPSASRTHLSPPSTTPRRPAARKSSKPSPTSSQNGLAAQARALYLTLANLARNMSASLQKNPTAMLQFLLFVLMFVIAASQARVRERVKRVVGGMWEKVRGTVGMGVKVSYI